MRFFKRKRVEEENRSIEQEKIVVNDLMVQQMFNFDYDVDIRHAKELVLEVYREMRMDDDPDVEFPDVYVGIRLFEDEVLKKDIIVQANGDSGLFSYTSVYRKASVCRLAIDLADAIARNLVFSAEFLDVKIKKRIVSKGHIFLLDIPSEYDVDMPQASAHHQQLLDFDRRRYDLWRKKEQNSLYDISDELDRLDREEMAYREEQMRK